MSAELLRHKELESLHQRRLLTSDLLPGAEGLGGIPPDHPALRSLHELPEGHPTLLHNAMLLLRHGAAAGKRNRHLGRG